MVESAFLFLGVSILYFGFAAVFGILFHRLIEHPATSMTWILVFLYSLFIFVPATMLVANLMVFSLVIRLVIIIPGLVIAAVAAVRPGWIPVDVWQQPFRGGYLAMAMGFAAMWSINYALTRDSNLTLLLGLAAASAAFASARSSFRPG